MNPSLKGNFGVSTSAHTITLRFGMQCSEFQNFITLRYTKSYRLQDYMIGQADLFLRKSCSWFWLWWLSLNCISWSLFSPTTWWPGIVDATVDFPSDKTNFAKWKTEVMITNSNTPLPLIFSTSNLVLPGRWKNEKTGESSHFSFEEVLRANCPWLRISSLWKRLLSVPGRSWSLSSHNQGLRPSD